MNEHLRPVFDAFLPSLENGGVRYWVYGGLSVAAHYGRFVRVNEDVDAFVRDSDFDLATELLEQQCETLNYPKPHASYSPRRRKLVIKSAANKSLLTIVSVKVNNRDVIHCFGNTLRAYPLDLLIGVERNVGGCRFFTPSDEHIKSLFRDYIRLRSGIPLRQTKIKIGKDARVILSPNELEGFHTNPTWMLVPSD